MKFNINRTVRVKLKPDGVRLFLERNCYQPWALAKIKDGWIDEQLWEVMRVFGPHLGMGGDPPIELEIEIPEDPPCPTS